MRALLIAACCALMFGGCATFPSGKSFKLSNPFSKKDKPPEPYPNPVKMATTWTPDTLTTVGKTPTRGFGGRVFFYNEKSQPVPVDGELLIVGYAESSRPDEPPSVKRFGFKREQFTQHFSQSDFGASYSFWIPWDADGGMQQRITLVPSFTSKEGKTIQGTPTAVLLPGPSEDSVARASGQLFQSKRYSGPSVPYIPPTGRGTPVGQGGAVQQTGYAGMEESVAPAQPRSGLKTTTIPLSSSFNRSPSR